MNEHDNIKHLAILFKLKDQNITKIEYEYSGSGDDGSIEYTTFSNYEDKSINPDITDEERESLEEHASEILTGVSDWWNNDGGYGTLTLITKDGSYIIDNNIASTSYENETWEGSFCDKSKHKCIETD